MFIVKLKKYIIYLCTLELILNSSIYAKNKIQSCETLENRKTCAQEIDMHDDILTLDGTKNTRYLGIYNDIQGNPLDKTAFLRSDNTNNLSEKDLNKLKEMNVKNVIDLRYPNEAAKAPNRLKDLDWVKYHNITIAVNRKYSLYDSYVKALECKKLIKKIFETIADAKEGTILFHCTYGKDRTGILSMLILGIANVRNEDIVKNYLDCYLFDCPPEDYEDEYKKNKENIEKVIKYITDKYDSFDNYILSTGLSKEGLHKVKERIHPIYNQELTAYLSDNCYDTAPTESDLEKYELFISGEYHATQRNHKVQKNIIKNLCEKTDLRYIISEDTMANALLINDYIQTGDKSKLDIIFSNVNGTYLNNKEQYEFYRWLYEFNKSLPENKKLTYLGWDIEHQYKTTIYYLKNLIKGKNIPETTKSFIKNFEAENVKANIPNILLSLEKVCADIESSPSSYDLGENSWVFKYLMENLLNTFKCKSITGNFQLWANARENAVISNFYKIYDHYSGNHKIKFYGEWGLYHCFLNNDDTIRLAKSLNNNEDSPFKNKVCSMAHVYFDSFGMKRNGGSYQLDNSDFFRNENKDLDLLRNFANDNKIKFLKLDNTDSPFSKKMYYFNDELKNGVTTDCFKYLVLIKGSKPCTKLN